MKEGKIVAIGDLHGSREWENIIHNNSDASKFVFLGDYVDSFDYSDEQIIKNLNNVIDFKKQNMDKVILLLGNHDIQYISSERYSGFRESYYIRLNEIFTENIKLFQIFYEETESVDGITYLFSHAGVTNDWIKRNEKIIDNYFCDGYYDYEDLNKIFMDSHDRVIFYEVGCKRGGTNKNGGPLWADMIDTIEDGDIGKHIMQIVGHTHTATIEERGNIVYCDTLNYGNKKPYIIKIRK